jgi:hypothetical protein
MYEYIVYLMEHGVYTTKNVKKTQEEADMIINQARETGLFEKYLLIVRDVNLDMPVQMETDYFSAMTRNKKGR